MNTHADKATEGKSHSSASRDGLRGASTKATFTISDQRPAAIVQQKQQEMANSYQRQQALPIQRKENSTGLPDQLKSGMESLSGYSMDDVRVHRNSSKPAQLQAHAYAQGTDIHLGAGQEKHLPHEAWHVVQQKQGRVKPTLQLKGAVKINDDHSLEREADLMGQKALQLRRSENQLPIHSSSTVEETIQRVLIIEKKPIKQITDLTDEQLKELEGYGIDKGDIAEFASIAIMALDARGEWDISLSTFAKVLIEVIPFLKSGEPVPAEALSGDLQPAVPVILTAFGLLKSSGPKVVPPESLVKNQSGFPPKHLQLIAEVLLEYPNLQKELELKGITVDMRNSQAPDFGGGVFFPERKIIGMASEEAGSTAEIYVRLLVHEAGHATFQRAIRGVLCDEASKMGGLELSWKIRAIRARKQALRMELQQLVAVAPPALTTPGSHEAGVFPMVPRIVSIKLLLDQLEADHIVYALQIVKAKAAIATLSQDGLNFYKAWQWLRKSWDGTGEITGKYMYGIDLGVGNKGKASRSATARQVYQAGNFAEFCAESFMHMALEYSSLKSFVADLLSSPDTPANVKLAWKNAMVVLEKYRRIILLGEI